MEKLNCDKQTKKGSYPYPRKILFTDNIRQKKKRTYGNSFAVTTTTIDVDVNLNMCLVCFDVYILHLRARRQRFVQQSFQYWRS